MFGHTGGGNGEGGGCGREKYGPVRAVTGGDQQPKEMGPADAATGVQTSHACTLHMQAHASLNTLRSLSVDVHAPLLLHSGI